MTKSIKGKEKKRVCKHTGMKDIVPIMAKKYFKVIDWALVCQKCGKVISKLSDIAPNYA